MLRRVIEWKRGVHSLGPIMDVTHIKNCIQPKKEPTDAPAANSLPF